MLQISQLGKQQVEKQTKGQISWGDQSGKMLLGQQVNGEGTALLSVVDFKDLMIGLYKKKKKKDKRSSLMDSGAQDFEDPSGLLFQVLMESQLFEDHWFCVF